MAQEKKLRNAVIVGGGLIGIETCEAFELAGIKSTVVEMQYQILPFLDWEMAKLVENHMASKGVKVITGKGVTRFIGVGNKIQTVEITGGERIPCEQAEISIGVRPNSKLAADASLKNRRFPRAQR